jgi:hypothetical protein
MVLVSPKPVFFLEKKTKKKKGLFWNKLDCNIEEASLLREQT